MYNLSYSGMLYIESHADILDYCARVGVRVEDLNICIRFENSVEDCKGIFSNMKSFNKSVIFPSSVRDISCAFVGCSSFSQYIFIDYKLYKGAGSNTKSLIKMLGLSDTYPEDRIIVTNNNKSFDLYLGKDMQFPMCVPGIIQLLKNNQPEELMHCKMLFRSLPEFRFTVTTVYVYLNSDSFLSNTPESDSFFSEISKLLDAAILVNAEMFANTQFKLIVSDKRVITEDEMHYDYLNRASINYVAEDI